MLGVIKKKLDDQMNETLAAIPDGHLKVMFEGQAKMYSHQSQMKFADSITKTAKEIEFLNLKKRVRAIFLRLLVSLSFIMIYHFLKIEVVKNLLPNDWRWKITISCTIILISGLFFWASISTLWKLVCIIIEEKESQGIALKETDGSNSTLSTTEENV